MTPSFCPSTVPYPSTQLDFLDAIKDSEMKAKLETYQNIGLSPYSIATAIAFVIEQPNGVDVSEIVVRPTAKCPGTTY